MRKISIVISVLLFISSMLFAGEFTSRGIKLGYNSSKFVGKELPGKGVSSIPGFSLGGFLNYKIKNNFSIQPEMFITSKGSNINTVGDINLHNVFLYFEIPVLAKMSFPAMKGITPNIFCGPAIAFKCLVMNDTGFLDDIRSTDFGLVLGAGIEFWKISMDVRYNRGLINFDKSDEDINLKNSAILFLIGYSF